MKEINKSRKNALIIYAASFFLPAAVIFLCFAARGVYPFGDNTVMTGDMTYQFVDYLSYLKTVYFGNNDFVYSLSKNLGGEMAGFAAYYFYSPFALITLLFPSGSLPFGVAVMLILYPGLCSLSMCVSLGKMHGLKNTTLIFSYAYGLMAYVVVYIELFHYFTNVCLLPLIFYGLKKLIDENRMNSLYILTLTFSIINNYYTGYMICIFCGFYYIYRVLLEKKYIKSAGNFILSSLLSGGMSAFVLLPAVKSLSGEKTALDIGFIRLFNPLDFMSKFYTGSFKGDFGTGLPNIYCSLTVLLLFLIYFFNRRISIKERVLTALVFVFFAVNFCINTFNVVWHGFNRPIGFPHRFAFLFAFFIIIKAAESFEDIENADVKKALLITAPIFLIYSFYLLISKNANTGLLNIVISFIALAASGVILLFMRKNRNIVWLLIVLEAADLGANAFLSLQSFGLTTMEEYGGPYSRNEELIGEVKKNDDSLYRLEKYFRRTHNDAFMHNYAGLSHFSSSEKLSTITFMGKLGFRDNGNWAFFGEGNDAFTDSLLGVKYLLSQYESTGKPYEKIFHNKDGYSIFRNPYALGLLFAAHDSVYGIDYMDYKDPFELQQKIADGIAGKKTGIFKKIRVKKVYEDAKKCTFSFKTEQDGIVEAYFTAPEEQNAHIFLNGMDYGQYFNTYRWNVLDLGEFKKGDELEISFESPDGDDINVYDAYIYNEDFDALERFFLDVMKDETEISKVTSSHFTGTASVISDSTELVFSVPYDENWEVYVDSERAEVKKACGNLIGISTGKGEHAIELKYVSPGQTAGYVISLISLVFYGVCVIRKKFFKNI